MLETIVVPWNIGRIITNLAFRISLPLGKKHHCELKTWCSIGCKCKDYDGVGRWIAMSHGRSSSIILVSLKTEGGSWGEDWCYSKNNYAPFVTGRGRVVNIGPCVLLGKRVGTNAGLVLGPMVVALPSAAANVSFILYKTITTKKQEVQCLQIHTWIYQEKN